MTEASFRTCAGIIRIASNTSLRLNWNCPGQRSRRPLRPIRLVHSGDATLQFQQIQPLCSIVVARNSRVLRPMHIERKMAIPVTRTVIVAWPLSQHQRCRCDSQPMPARPMSLPIEIELDCPCDFRHREVRTSTPHERPSANSKFVSVVRNEFRCLF